MNDNGGGGIGGAIPGGGGPKTPKTLGASLGANVSKPSGSVAAASQAALSGNGTAAERAKAGAKVGATSVAAKAASAAATGATGNAALGAAAAKAVQVVGKDPKRAARWVMWAVGATVAVIALVVALAATLTTAALSGSLAAAGNYEAVQDTQAGCGPMPVGGIDALSQEYTPAQWGFAGTVVDTASTAGADQYGSVIALTAALADSGLVNLTGVDNKFGVFAQQVSSGWGTADGLQDPATATKAFLNGGSSLTAIGLLNVDGWEAMPVMLAAQTVQHSSTPSSYRQFESDAQVMVALLLHVTTGYTCTPPGQMGGGDWAYPLPLGTWQISSPFNPYRMHPVFHIPMPHNGVDLAAPSGTPVYAVEGGLLQTHPWWGTCGNGIQVTLDDGNVMMYCHMSVLVATNGPVRAGDLIGLVGSTGASTGSHLHFEIRIGGVPVNPIPLLTEHGVSLN